MHAAIVFLDAELQPISVEHHKRFTFEQHAKCFFLLGNLLMNLTLVDIINVSFFVWMRFMLLNQ